MQIWRGVCAIPHLDRATTPTIPTTTRRAVRARASRAIQREFWRSLHQGRNEGRERPAEVRTPTRPKRGTTKWFVEWQRWSRSWTRRRSTLKTTGRPQMRSPLSPRSRALSPSCPQTMGSWNTRTLCCCWHRWGFCGHFLRDSSKSGAD